MRPVAFQHPTIAGCPVAASAERKEFPMLDLAMLALGLGCFVAAVGYTYACERL